MMGTPYYMSLEQMNGQRDLDQRVDVYAMGVILYEALAGALPYVADSMAALAIRMLTAPPVHLAELRPDLPPGLADVVMVAIARRTRRALWQHRGVDRGAASVRADRHGLAVARWPRHAPARIAGVGYAAQHRTGDAPFAFAVARASYARAVEHAPRACHLE